MSLRQSRSSSLHWVCASEGQRQRHASFDITRSRIAISGRPDPASYVVSLPIVPIPTKEWMNMHIESCKKHVDQVISILIKQIKDIQADAAPWKKSAEHTLIDKKESYFATVQQFLGRGLAENRTTFVLMHRVVTLTTKQHSLYLSDSDNRLKHYQAMLEYLKSPPDFSLFYVSVDLKGYMSDIPNHREKLERIKNKLERLKPFVKTPNLLPPPSDLVGQLIYPTSTTFGMFQQIEKTSATARFEDVLREFKEMTDDSSELEILLDLAFEFAWRETQFPFLDKHLSYLPTFIGVRVSLFGIPFMPDKFQEMHVEDLMNSDWPYTSVTKMLFELFFMINPMKMARLVYDAMEEAGRIIAAMSTKPMEIDFDTIFPLIMICTLATGLTADRRILPFISEIGRQGIDDSYCQLGASYTDAIIKHILTLNELEMISETKRIEMSLSENKHIENC